jgi:hypothetical protein
MGRRVLELRGRADGNVRLALHARENGREPISPSAGPGHAWNPFSR